MGPARLLVATLGASGAAKRWLQGRGHDYLLVGDAETCYPTAERVTPEVAAAWVACMAEAAKARN
jgi:hypothetical protein